MKIVFNLLVVALAVAAGWFLHPDVVKWMDSRKLAAKKAFNDTVEAAMAAKGETTAPKGGSGSRKDLSNAAQELAQSMRKGGPQTAAPNPGGAETGTDGTPSSGSETMKPAGGTGMASSPPAVDEIEARYPLPSFKPIEDITKEWSSIPSRAFPRTVKTLVAVTFEGPNGKIKLPEQSDALAVGMVQGMLVLMRNKEDPSRSMVPLANTDLKQSLTTLYDKFKTFKTDEVMKQRQRARDLKSRANGATAAELAAAGPKPKVDDKGVIVSMMQSLQAKEIKETTADRVVSWGDLNVEEVQGKAYWTGTVQCTVDNAIFGPIPTELIALIREEKVVKWLYSGSREEVQ